jgi:integrase
MVARRTYSKSTGFAVGPKKNERDATIAEADAKREVISGRHDLSNRTSPVFTFREFCDTQFEPRMKKTIYDGPGYGPHGSIRMKTWVDFYRCGMNTLLSYTPIADAPLDKITRTVIEEFARTRRNTKNGSGKHLSLSTVNSGLRVLRRILGTAAEWTVDGTEDGPTFLMKVPKFKVRREGEAKRDRVLTLAEEQAYLAQAFSTTISPEKPEAERRAEIERRKLLGDLFIALFDTGARPNEIFSLRWSAVRWDEEGTLHGELRIVYAKSTHGVRSLPISGRVHDMLRARWEASGKPLDDSFVFPAPGNPKTREFARSGHVEASSIKKTHAAICVAAGVPKFIFYDGRHSALTRLAGICRDPYIVRNIAGHATLEQSLSYVKPRGYEYGKHTWWNEWWRFTQEGKKGVEAVSIAPSQPSAHVN